MHRDTFLSVSYAPASDFLITASVDGFVKFWKIQVNGIEFVKQYRAHTGAIIATSCSADGLLYATIGEEKTIKVFDVVNFGNEARMSDKLLIFYLDMINVIALDFEARTLGWIYKLGSRISSLAV
jgi:peptidylprolyl isomerase domain and WD repeat-containing protein 1